MEQCLRTDRGDSLPISIDAPAYGLRLCFVAAAVVSRGTPVADARVTRSRALFR